MKKGVFKKIFNFAAPIVRGIVKVFPFGNVAVEAAQNIQHEFEKRKEKAVAELNNAVNDMDAPKDASISQNKPHRWRSIIVQAIGVGCVLYAFYIKAITLEQVLAFLETALKFIP